VWGRVAGCCENGNELPASMKCWRVSCPA